jgi:hypothetical protein
MNKFEKIIGTVSDIANGYRHGLDALGAHSHFIMTASPRLIDGSVNIDDCTRKYYPNDNRWDYVISHRGKAYYLEVHPATAGKVKEVIAKKQWLLGWLKEKASILNNYPSGNPKFTWIFTGRCGLSKTSTEYRRAAQMGLIPVNCLNLE